MMLVLGWFVLALCIVVAWMLIRWAVGGINDCDCSADGDWYAFHAADCPMALRRDGR